MSETPQQQELGETENDQTQEPEPSRDASSPPGLAQGVIDVYVRALRIAQRNAWVAGYIHRRNRRWDPLALAEEYYPHPTPEPVPSAADILRLVDAYGFAIGSGNGDEASIRAEIVAGLATLMLTERASVPAVERSRSYPDAVEALTQPASPPGGATP